MGLKQRLKEAGYDEEGYVICELEKTIVGLKAERDRLIKWSVLWEVFNRCLKSLDSEEPKK